MAVNIFDKLSHSHIILKVHCICWSCFSCIHYGRAIHTWIYPLKPSHDSLEINELAESRLIADRQDTDPLRQVYLSARYSDRAITQDDVNLAKEQLKRIKDGR